MNEKVKIRTLDLDKRLTTFEEVSLGYNKKEAMEEASRCLNCKNPKCVEGCPVNINIPKFISLIKNDLINEAYEEIKKANSFPGICGRVCPQESQCEGKCIRGIKGESVAIGRLERFASEYNTLKDEKIAPLNGKSVGVVGSGPAGLSFASNARDKGYDVTIYEALHLAGGVLRYGIPEFRLPKRIVDAEINGLLNKGVKIELNYVIGKSITLDELLEKHDYVFIGSGAGLPKFMNIPGENLSGVMSANEFLTRVNLMKGYLDYDTPLIKAKKVVVVGGGNVAMDAARSAKRIGAEVTLVYRRNVKAMPARLEEIHHAIEEDIKIHDLTNPYEIVGDELGRVKAINCDKMALGEADASGRPSFNKTGEKETIECDLVIMAISNFPNPLIKDSTDLIKFTDLGLIVVDDANFTTNPKILAGGDIVTGAATVILAMGAGKKAASNLK